jgi:large subunit ribosomal protein L20
MFIFLFFIFYFCLAKNCIRLARNRVEKSLLHAYIGRKLKKRDFRSLWITKINAGTRQYDIQYSKFIHGCQLSHIHLNRKMLAELAEKEPYSFQSVVQQVKKWANVPTK